MNQSQLTLRLLAVAERIDGPESWVHLCVTAAQETTRAVLEDEGPATTGDELTSMVNRLAFGGRSHGNPATSEQVLQRVRERGGEVGGWELRHLLGLAAAHASGKLITQRAEDAAEAAASAFRNTLPPITNRRSVQCFVACVAAGVLRGFIAAKDANALLVAANAALSAHPKRNKTRTSKG